VLSLRNDAHGEKQQPLPRTPPSSWPWPDSLDALIAAPDHHSLLFENEHVRVIRTRIFPGQIVPVHTSLASCFNPVELERFRPSRSSGQRVARHADDLRSAQAQYSDMAGTVASALSRERRRR